MNNVLKGEIDQIAAAAPQKLLKPEMLVDFAKANPDCELNKEFNWDDTEAANLYRIGQARNLIRVYVTRLPGIPQPVRGYLSLPSDRTQGGGYRPTEDITKIPQRRAELVNQALKECERMKTRYAYLPELEPFFKEVVGLVENTRKAMVVSEVA